jgi:hypothetical protein
VLGLVSRVVPCLRAEVCIAIVDFAEVAVRNRPVACVGTSSRMMLGRDIIVTPPQCRSW